MSQFLTTLKTRGRAAVIALALGAASMTAMPAPAMAQNFSFDFGISGGESNFSFGIGKGGVRIKRDCLTNNEIRRGLRRSGFEDIRFLDRRGNRVSLIAEWDGDGRDYSMRVNRCTGRVSDIERVRRRGGGGNGGFGLQFEIN
jgi:hypothetical protein